MSVCLVYRNQFFKLQYNKKLLVYDFFLTFVLVYATTELKDMA